MDAKIPFFDLNAQYTSLADEIHAALQPIFEASAYSGGAEVERFENEFAAYCGVNHAVAVNSGTSALHLALLAAGIGPGDEVITTPMTFVATVAAIEYAGAKPVFVDCDPITLAIDPSKIGPAITSHTKAIIPVHLHGRLTDMEPIMALADRAGVIVIEDAAQAHGAQRAARKAGAWGNVGCFSFYPSKNLGAYGEGGALTTDDPDIAKKAQLLRSWGSDQRYVHRLKGFNYRMDGLQAAVLRVKLRKLDEWNMARQQLAGRYTELLQGLDLTLPVHGERAAHVFHVYAVRTPHRDRLQQWLEAAGVGTSIHYPIPVHLQEAYASPRYPLGSLPVSENIASELLSLPLFPEMPSGVVDQVCARIRTFFETLK
jgi:dTDP-4-amino-4,6-dideoxygalactose transaminase